MYERKKVFTLEFFKKNFEKELKEDGIDTRLGYPDVGSGYYSQKLSHSEWKQINNAQRGHVNFLETVVPVLMFMLVSGLSFPRLTIILQTVYVVARWFYAANYTKSGPKGRYAPVMVIYFCFVSLSLTAFASAYLLGGGIEGLVSTFVGK